MRSSEHSMLPGATAARIVRSACILLFLALATSTVFAQGATGGAPRNVPDSNIIFHSPRPLIEPLESRQFRNAWGIDILFSNYGFGGGAFYRHEYSEEFSAFAMLEISGVKNSNEITLYDPYTGVYIQQAGKLNNIYMLPVSLGLQYRLFASSIAESFRPYLNAGVGPTMIIAAPDSLDFFPSIAHAGVYFAPDFFIGLGAYFGRDPRTVNGVSFRYYYIPYKSGVESIQGNPITDLGGFFITLNWGMAF